MKKSCVTLPVLASILLLAGCASTETVHTSRDDRSARVSSAIETATTQAQSGSSASAGAIYKNQNNATNAIRYARQLRREGDFTKASAVLSPFVNDPASSAEIKSEYAALQLELGNYAAAIKYAQMALALKPNDPQAYQMLGIAQDAQGDHVGAEASFRKALSLWKSDKIPVMNNLALALANQNKIDEAVAILQEAKKMGPGRVEIERNLRIISTLNEKVQYKQPNTGAAMPDIYGNKAKTASVTKTTTTTVTTPTELKKTAP
ncbi:MAG: tetratricopeptide repeat protein [Pseudomonadota bacterium]